MLCRYRYLSEIFGSRRCDGDCLMFLLSGIGAAKSEKYRKMETKSYAVY